MRVILDPQHRDWQERVFRGWWAISKKADLLAWLALQAVVQQAQCPKVEVLVEWSHQLRDTGELPGGLLYPDPARHAFTPQAIRAILRKRARSGGIDQDALVAVVQAALELDYRQGLNRQAQLARLRTQDGAAALPLTALQGALDGPLEEVGDPSDLITPALNTPASAPGPSTPTPVFPTKKERKLLAAAWGQALPLGLIDGVVRRLMGPLLHLPGLPDEVAFGRIPQPLGPGSTPFLTLKDVRADGDSALLILRGTGQALRIPAAVFLLPEPWKEALLNAPGNGRFTDLAAQGAYGADGARLDDDALEPGDTDERWLRCQEELAKAGPVSDLNPDDDDLEGLEPDDDLDGDESAAPTRRQRSGRRRGEGAGASGNAVAVQDRRPLRAVTLTLVDGQWRAWLRLGGPVAALPPCCPPPTKGVIGVDLGVLRLMTLCDGEGPDGRVPAPMTPARDGQPARPLAAQDLKELMWTGGTMADLRTAYFRLKPHLDLWYEVLSPYGRVAFEALGAGPSGVWDQPPGRVMTQEERERRDLAQTVERTLLWVVLQRLAADRWPGIGRRSVVSSPRMFSSRRCPNCERALRAGELPEHVQPGCLQDTDSKNPRKNARIQARIEAGLRRQGRVPQPGERWRVCSRCETVYERDEAGAMNHWQSGVWLGRTLAHLWAGLPGDLQAHLRAQTRGAELNYRQGTANPADELDCHALPLPTGPEWDVVRPTVAKRPQEGEAQTQVGTGAGTPPDAEPEGAGRDGGGEPDAG